MAKGLPEPPVNPLYTLGKVVIKTNEKEEKIFEGSSALDTDKENKQDDKKDMEEVNDKDSKKATTENTEQGKVKDNIQDNVNNNGHQTLQDNKQSTTQYINKYTIETPGKTELVNERLVANVTKRQKKYVKEMSKKFENESAFVRFILDYFMKNVEIK